MSARPRREGKGIFGEARLPVAQRYPRRRGRSWLLVFSLVLGVAVLGLGAADVVFRQGVDLSKGRLSSAHAALDEDCAACHEPLGTVQSERCSICHERYGDRLGVYTYAAHYVYRSGDFQRIETSPHEVGCAACHGEHGGRGAALTDVEDARCLRCHEGHSFAHGHPQFPAVEKGLEDARIAFPHVHHTREVMKRLEAPEVERACLYCHNPDPSGRGFEELDFERHCAACHLPPTTSTQLLPVEGPGRVGVRTLEDFRRESAPGNAWTAFVNPADFRRSGDEVRKSPVVHADPWILANLRYLRQLRFPDAGLADLLRSSSQVAPGEEQILYREALAFLESGLRQLQGVDDRRVQRELRRQEAVLQEVERRLRDPYTPLDETKFLLSLPPSQERDDARREEIDAVVQALVEPCGNCHLVSDATIVRVQKDQSTLRRAEFDHRAHIVQRRCLECHRTIPVLENLAGTDKLPPAVDRADLLNLPGVETCRSCHTPGLSSSRCVTCHLFHPDRSRRSELLLYLER